MARNANQSRNEKAREPILHRLRRDRERRRSGQEILLDPHRRSLGPRRRRAHDPAARTGSGKRRTSIPKGLIAPDGIPLAAAKREFAEETGHRPRGRSVPLGEAKQPGGKIVHVWAVEGDWNCEDLNSNLFEMEWQRRSGRRQTFPELDRAAWFGVAEAGDKILKAQVVFLTRLAEALAGGS